jgi:antitoxin MazE
MGSTIARWGNSLGVRIPKAALEAAGLHEGDAVTISERDGELRITRSNRIDLDAMIAMIRPENLHTDDPWLSAPPVGREIL